MVQRSSFRKKRDPSFKLVSRGVSIKREPVFLGGVGPSAPNRDYFIPDGMIGLEGWNGTVVAAAPNNFTMTGSFEMVRLITLKRTATPSTIEVLYGRFDDIAETGWLIFAAPTFIGFTVFSVSGSTLASIPIENIELNKVYILFGMYYVSGGIQVAEIYRHSNDLNTAVFIDSDIAGASGSDGGYRQNASTVKTTVGNKIDGTIPCPSFTIINVGGTDGVTWTTSMMNQMANDIKEDYKLDVIPLDYIPEGGTFIPREIYNAAYFSASNFVWPENVINYPSLTFTGSVSASVVPVSFIPTFA